MKDHKISLFSAVLLNMNIMIGSGILIGSQSAAGIAGNASFLGWSVVFLCFLPLVLSVIKLGQLFPGTGGLYLYAKQGLGEIAGFISAWLYITGYTFTVVVECLALRQTLAVSTNNYWLFTNPLLFNFLLLSFCTLISLATMRLISGFLNSLTIIKLLPLITLILLIPLIWNSSFTITTSELQALPLSLPLMIFGFFGFEYCTSLSHLIKDSDKNAPRAILLGFLATVVIYSLFHFGLLNLMGSENLAHSGASAFASFLDLPIPYLSTILSLLIPVAASITLFAVALGVMNSNATLLHSLAQEKIIAGSGLLTRTTALHRPWVALVLQAIVALILLTILPNINLAGNLCMLAVFASFLLPIVSLIAVAKRRKLSGALIIGIIGLLALIGFLSYSWYMLSPTVAERLAYSAIILVSLAFGFLLKKLR